MDEMAQDLTKRYSSLFEKKGLRHALSFALDLYRSGKAREFASFAVWESMHRSGLFPRKAYVQFNNEALALDDARLNDPEFDAKLDSFSASRGLSITRAGHNWKLVCVNNTNEEMLGCLYREDRDLYRSVDKGKSLMFVHNFPERIKALFVSSQNTIFVCVRGTVFRSSDNGASFTRSLELSSAQSFFRPNNGMTETPDKTLVIGEYGNVWGQRGWQKLAYLYFSSDNGQTWQTSAFLIGQGTNKHVHIVRYSGLLNRLLVSDGDNKKKLWVSDSFSAGDLENVRWNAINRYHIQLGGYTAVAETDEKVLFGTDYQGGTNFVVDTTDCRKFIKRVVPDPYRRSPIDNMVQRKSQGGREIWANLPYSTAGTKCLLMYTADGGNSWNKVLEYDSAAYKVWLVSSSNRSADEMYFSIEDTRHNERVVYKIADCR